MKTRRPGSLTLLLLAGAAAAAAQATAPQFSAPVALPGDAARKTSVVVIDAPLTLTRDAATGFVHMTAPAFIVDPPLTLLKNAAGESHISVEFMTGPVPLPGTGLVMEPVNGAPDQSRIAIDKTQVLARVVGSPVIGSPCPGDAGVMVDRAFLYVCVPPAPGAATDPANVPGWTWAGAALTLVAAPAAAPAVTPPAR